jgi:uncharacterized protein (TIGR03435 family)
MLVRNLHGCPFFLLVALGAVPVSASPAYAQTAARPQTQAASPSAAAPVFAVASIRPHQGLLSVVMGFDASGPRLTLEGYNMWGLVMEAYNLRNYQVSFAGSNVGPDGDENTNYDISAIADGNDSPTRDQFRQMLQALLVERFKLKFHRETKEMPVYALVVGKSGPKFKQSAPDAIPSRHAVVNGRNQGVVLTKAGMDSLAYDINNTLFVDRPVIDKTGLTGTYDLQLEATPEFRITRNPQPGDLSTFDAVQDQLGLKLEPQKANIEILVVDHMERPSEN